MDLEELRSKLVGFEVSDCPSLIDNCPDLEIDSKEQKMINETLQLVQKHGQIKNNDAKMGDNTCSDQKQRYSEDEMMRTNKILYQEFHKKRQNSDMYQKMQEERQKLPAWEVKDFITAAVKRHKVIIVSGMTGCGKTTQVPQFILDDALESDNFRANIICTQPRRIAATSIAERVAAERDDTLGNLVGYQIRLDGEVSYLTRLLFCTTGIVLRRLEGDPNLEGVTHVIVDEVHERSELSDFLILVLKRLLVQRPDLRVILMSATINAKLFSEYFNNCPIINIPGQLFPVKQFFLEDIIEQTKYCVKEFSEYSRSDRELHWMLQSHEHREAVSDKTPDKKLSEYQLAMRYQKCSRSTIKTMSALDFDEINYDLIVHLLEWIVTEKHKEFPLDGAILVFLPGLQEIQKTFEELQVSKEFSRNIDRYVIIALHSSFSSDEQKAVFHKPKPGIRKIVLSTNIAETSITIDDVAYVVDVGRMKEMRYDHEKSMQSLDLIWVSRTNAEQRKGRAGRVQEGVCFHLFTSHMYKHILRPHPVPEIQRNSLEQVIIRTKILSVFRGHDIEIVLQDLIDAPSTDRIRAAVQSLKDIGALDSQMELTALGYHLGSIPVDVRIGKLMLYGLMFRCLDATLTMAATLSYKSPFITPFKKKEEATFKKKELKAHNSDIQTMLKAYKEWWEARGKGRESAYKYCKEFFLSFKHLEMISTLKQQYVEILSDIGFIKKKIKFKDVQTSAKANSDGVAIITGREANENNENMELLTAMLVAALYPNIIQHVSGKVKTRTGEYVDIHPNSVNFKVFFKNGSFLVYHEKVKTKKIYIRECSLVSQLSLLMFAGGGIEVDECQGYKVLIIDKMIKYKTHGSEVASSLKALRSELNQLLSDKITEPDIDLMSSPKGSALIKCINYLLAK
ncbi:putative ATP-dependent RNA helicase DHX57 [Biomphalaria glabrata]|uniref:Putative ATP-dependent RNA helicase DHX57 n=1 Tax=Biomphalaria glabrata TaxID=6526 RepID=A0A9W2ZTT1_BIOGL|nr:putative ATP-dependent RNA helicase DHX57 [Biomphalaria glabrata]XP_055878294.1 putative ATP-dependent RNA helicase DHX57 [Biomphalaria glabrata]